MSRENKKTAVTGVSWLDAVAYCAWLSEKTGKEYRLPSEAEWEYAARGGVNGAKDNFTYAGSDNIDEVAWYNGNAGGKVHPVGQLKKNQLGLYDMSGNVWEWCADTWGPYAGCSSASETDSTRRVIRGDSWDDVMTRLHASHAAIRAVVSDYSEDDLFTKRRFAWTGSTSVASYVILATTSHYDWTRTLIRRFVRAG